MKLSNLKPADYNPRGINASEFEGLKNSISEFGDISGITFNKKTQCLVTGHQRVKALTEKYGDLEIIRLSKDEGIIKTPEGQFKVRFVEWDEIKEKAANIAANAETIQGKFTDGLIPILQEVSLKLPDLNAALRLNQVSIDLHINSELVEAINHQDEWKGLPKYEDGTEPFKLVINFDSEDIRNEFLKVIQVNEFTGKSGKTLSFHWPPKGINDLSSIRFVQNEKI